MEYEEVHVISSSLILQHQVSVQQTTEEEALWEMLSVTVCSVFAMATLYPAPETCSSWKMISIEGK